MSRLPSSHWLALGLLALSGSPHSAKAEVQTVADGTEEGTTVQSKAAVPADEGLFRSPNRQVAEGNARMELQDAKGALAAYDQAAKALPNAAGVHLNRGLALLAQNDIDKSRTALQLATQPPASREIRAAAYYNLGNSFFQEADALAGQEQHDQAQARFREAVDVYKSALRLQPDLAEAAWNLELAQRRVQEEQDKAEQQQDDQNQDQNQDPQQNEDSDQQDPQQQQQDPKSEPEQGESGDQGRDPEQQPEQKPQQQDGDQEQAQDRDQGQAQQDSQQAEGSDDQTPPPPPSEVDRALDALQDSEENLERYRAQQRARRERRRPEKDW